MTVALGPHGVRALPSVHGTSVYSRQQTNESPPQPVARSGGRETQTPGGLI